MARRPALLLLVPVLGLGTAACGGGSSGSKATGSTPAPGGAPAAGAAGGGTATDAIEVKDFAFKPGSATVKAGTKVTWTFKDDAAHNVEPVGDGNPIVKSPDLKAGGTYSTTFAKAGTFPYRCGIHNFMSGSVTVTG